SSGLGEQFHLSTLSPQAGGEGRVRGKAKAPKDYAFPAPRIATASISTRNSGAAKAFTSTSVDTGKSPVNTSRRAFHTSSRRLMSVTKMSTFTTSFMVPPAASIRCLILAKMAWACAYMLSPPTAPSDPRATMPAMYTWLPTTRQFDHVWGGGSGTCGLVIFSFIPDLLSWVSATALLAGRILPFFTPDMRSRWSRGGPPSPDRPRHRPARQCPRSL